MPRSKNMGVVAQMHKAGHFLSRHFRVIHCFITSLCAWFVVSINYIQYITSSSLHSNLHGLMCLSITYSISPVVAYILICMV
jgi:hypothetical protein